MSIPAFDALDTTAKDILDRRTESEKHMRSVFWEEFEDTWRSVNVRTKPVYVKDAKGNRIEDDTRTNVCMPELALATRKATARLTANPPQIDYTVPGDSPDKLIGERLSANAYQQWDRAGEAVDHRLVVLCAKTFGIAYSKTFFDSIQVTRRFRYDRSEIKDRQRLMQLQGRSPEDIQSAISQKGPEVTLDEIVEDIARNGPTLAAQVPTTKYEGPVTRFVFLGDMHLEPGYKRIHDSAWAIEEYEESDLWVQKMAARTYIDPDTGEELPAFDVKALEDLLDTAGNDSGGAETRRDSILSLREQLRAALGNQSANPRFPRRLIPGKRFKIIECHERDKYGRNWISWIGNETQPILLGRQPYPWDLYGRYMYGEFIPQPNLLGAIGDSSPRILRYLHAMHNAAVGSTRDLVNAALRPTVLVQNEEDIPDEVLERKLLRVMRVKNMGTIRELPGPQVPPEAYQEQEKMLREMSLYDPNIGVTQSGTDVNPQAGKTATTAILAAKSSDVLMNAEIDYLNLYLKDVEERKLWIWQQQDGLGKMEVAGNYVHTEGLSQRDGKTKAISIDPMEIQEDIGVEPVAGSTLSIDDEIRRNGLIQAYQFALQDPATWNKPYIAKQLAATMRGVDPDQAVNPPSPPQPPGPRISWAISTKYDPPEAMMNEVVTAALGDAGIQLSPEAQQEMDADSTLKGIGRLSEAGDAAANLETPANPAMFSEGVHVPGLQQK